MADVIRSVNVNMARHVDRPASELMCSLASSLFDMTDHVGSKMTL